MSASESWVATHPEVEPIWSNEAEMATLGSMLLSERACAETGWLNVEMFYQPAHQKVFGAVRSLYDSGRQIDLVTVKDRLIDANDLGSIGGVEYLVQIAESVPTAKNANYYAEIVRDKWVMRELESRLFKALDNVRNPEETAGQKVELATSIPNGLLDASTFEFHPTDILESLTESTKPGLATGISAIDQFSDVGGLYPDEPNVIAALTGVGKTNIGLNLAVKWCQEGKRVALVTLELKAEKVVRRMMKMLCGYGDLARARRDGKEAEWDRAKAEMQFWDLMIYDPSKTRGGTKNVETVCEWLIAKHERKPLDGCVLDYAQFFKSRQKSQGKTQLMEIVEEELRSTNGRLGCVMVVLAQLITERDKNGKAYYAIRNSREFGLGSAFYLQILGNEQEGYKLVCEKNRSGRVHWEHLLFFDRENLTFSSHPSTSMR